LYFKWTYHNKSFYIKGNQNRSCWFMKGYRYANVDIFYESVFESVQRARYQNWFLQIANKFLNVNFIICHSKQHCENDVTSVSRLKTQVKLKGKCEILAILGQTNKITSIKRCNINIECFTCKVVSDLADLLDQETFSQVGSSGHLFAWRRRGLNMNNRNMRLQRMVLA
jgi:hypothetical protein